MLTEQLSSAIIREASSCRTWEQIETTADSVQSERPWNTRAEGVSHQTLHGAQEHWGRGDRRIVGAEGKADTKETQQAEAQLHPLKL